MFNNLCVLHVAKNLFFSLNFVTLTTGQSFIKFGSNKMGEYSKKISDILIVANSFCFDLERQIIRPPSRFTTCQRLQNKLAWRICLLQEK